MTPTICLNMIVKNESAIIIRLLDSVKSIIDYVCICDTGSTDNTIDLIETWMKDNNKTGKIVKKPFKNFGYNRTFGIRAAQKHVKEADYLLFLDADMKLVIGPSFSKDMLKENNYSIAQKSTHVTYYNLRIVKTSSPIECVGVTHEYYNVPGGHIKLPEDILHIADIGDGGSKGDKIPRDIRLLTAGLEDPETPKDLKGRYHFYLANTYFDIGNYELAHKTYIDRINVGGWHEELWYSKYKIGLCMFRLNKVPDGISSMLEAYEFHPKRVEPLYEIIKKYRELGKQNVAYMFYKEAKGIPYPEEDVLFINHTIYKYELDYELSVIGYYVKHPNIDKVIVKLLNEMPNANFGHLMNNYKFYTKKVVKDIRDFTDHSVFPDFNSSTPCIVSLALNPHSGVSLALKHRQELPLANSKTEYMMFVRHVNHTYEIESGAFINKDKITSCYRVVMLDSSFHKINEYKLDYPDSGDLHYQGIEDVKLFNYKNEYRFVGTMQAVNGNLCIGSGVYTPTEHTPTEHPYLQYCEVQSPNNRRCEKNWCFYADKDNDLRVMYEWENLQTYKFENGKLSDLKTMKTPPIFKHFRGSTHGIRDVASQNIVWFLTHLVQIENNKRSYYHVIVIVDFCTSIIRYTVPFKFEGENVEFALGMIVRDNDVVVSYSMNEISSKLGFISKFEIASMLV